MISATKQEEEEEEEEEEFCNNNNNNRLQKHDLEVELGDFRGGA